jgi:hypothetical protein
MMVKSVDSTTLKSGDLYCWASTMPCAESFCPLQNRTVYPSGTGPAYARGSSAALYYEDLPLYCFVNQEAAFRDILKNPEQCYGDRVACAPAKRDVPSSSARTRPKSGLPMLWTVGLALLLISGVFASPVRLSRHGRFGLRYSAGKALTQ